MQSPLSTLLFAAIYHESGRPSVAAGNTLAHSVGQAKPFTEFADLEPDAQHGRITTAGLILAAVEPWCPATGSTPLADAVDWLARIIHNAERTAIENGWVVIKLNPPRPWILADTNRGHRPRVGRVPRRQLHRAGPERPGPLGGVGLGDQRRAAFRQGRPQPVPARAASGERQDDQGAGRRLARVCAPRWWGSAPGDTRMKEIR